MSKRDSVIRASDLWFAGALLGTAALSALLLFGRPSGTEVIFRRDGQEISRQPLSTSGTIEIDGAYTNVFMIEDGSVRVVETDCPNGACQAAGTISQAGDAIICAPNHVSATIEGRDGTLDAYTG